MKGLASPVHEFLLTWCVLDPTKMVPTDRLYQAFQTWSAKQGQKHIPNHATFGKDLAAAAPSVLHKRLSVGGKPKSPHYVGVRLKPGLLDE